MTEPLFEVEQAQPGADDHQACDRCLTVAWATIDGLRVRGWTVYDGTSATGRELHVRICPTCTKKGATQ